MHGKIISALPTRFRIEIFSILSSRLTRAVSEIRLRSGGISFITVGGEKIRLFSRISSEEIERTVFILTGGESFLYRDSEREGYITLGGGVRMGICGVARYDGETLVGISEPSSLVFRIPTGRFEFSEELYSAFLGCERGLLVYSRSGVGKTSALRELSRMIGETQPVCEVAVIDERYEFLPEDYKDASVDLLRGYKRARGMEIALRTLGAEVIVIDEIGSVGEAHLIAEFMRAGARILASAHASSPRELYARRGVRELLSLGAFDVLFGMDLYEGRRTFSVFRTEELSYLSEYEEKERLWEVCY